MKKSLAFAALLLFCLPFVSRAQFHVDGTDRASTKWKEMQTDNFRIIYPSSQSKLARSYADSLESLYYLVGNSLGRTPNQAYRSKMPVILHCESALSNGKVVWTPRRMSLFCCPDATSPYPVPWQTQLLQHEMRHSAQMQYVNSRPYKFLNVLTGQLFQGAMAALYCGPFFFEGDAVVAETALSNSGRGRTADFLEYYRVSFDKSDYRNFWKWLYGSQKYYTPNHYAFGYLNIAGNRYLSGNGEYLKDYYDIVSSRFLPFSVWNRTAKKNLGMKRQEAFAADQKLFQGFWHLNDSLRGSFMPSRPVTSAERKFVEISALVNAPDGIYAIRSGLAHSRELVRIGENGHIDRISAFANSTSRLSFDGRRLLWAETVRHPRWENVSLSPVRSWNGSQKQTLTQGERLFNPYAGKDGGFTAVRYLENTQSSICIFDAHGNKQKELTAPSKYQIVECVSIDNRLIASAIANEGFFLLDASHNYSVLAGPYSFKIGQLQSRNGKVLFVADRTSVNELYSFDPRTGIFVQLSNTRHGAQDFVFRDGYAYYTMLSKEGRMIYKTAEDSLFCKEADMSASWDDPVARELSNQEKKLSERIKEAPSGKIYREKDYSKAGHLFKFHSWAPLAVNIDNISSLSFDNLRSSVWLGATAFFQNDLSTSYGYVSYRVPDQVDLSYTYQGLYPVFELKGTANRSYSGASLKTYIPFNLSSGGYLRGIIPSYKGSFGWDYAKRDSVVFSNRHTVSLRAYTVQSIAGSCIYPRLGIGAEIGYSWRSGSGDVTPNLYAYLYGYLPELIREQGLRLSFTGQMHTRKTKYAEPFISISPRGFTGNDISRQLCAYQYQFKMTADYAIPFGAVDWSFLCPLFYIRNFELIPHFDYTHCSAPSANKKVSLMSSGADFDIRLSNFIWIPYDTRIGVSWSYNTGTIENIQKHYFGLIFSIDF